MLCDVYTRREFMKEFREVCEEKDSDERAARQAKKEAAREAMKGFFVQNLTAIKTRKESNR